MKRLLLPFGALFLLLIAPSAFAEWEVGVSLFPASSSSIVVLPSSELNWMIGLHVGSTFLGSGYASWDGISLPDYLTKKLSAGAFRVPSFLNLYDLGLHLGKRTVFGFVQLGLNNLWIYDVGLEPLTNTGANIRAGAGVKFQIWGIDLSATEVYPSIGALAKNLAGVVTDGTSGAAFQTLAGDIIWSVGLNLYFP